MDSDTTNIQPQPLRLPRRFQAALSRGSTPALIAVCYVASFIYLGLRFHVGGDLRHEADFFGAYVAETRVFLDGGLTVGAYRGPVYPMILGILHFLLGWLGGGLFETAIVLSCLSAGVVILATYHVTMSRFSPDIALVATALLVSNPTFVRCSYTTGSDMLFCALATAGVWALLRPGLVSAGGALFAGAVFALAFLTRYNGVFLPVGGATVVLVLDGWRQSLRRRWSSAAALTVGFLVVLGPWLLYSKHETGHFLVNENYMNVAYAFYLEGESTDAFRAAHEGDFGSFADVVRYRPTLFFSRLPGRVSELVFGAVGRVVSWPVGAVAALGLLLIGVRRPTRRQLSYYLFGALFLATLVPVFFAERFALFAIPVFATLAACALTKLQRPGVAAAVAAVLILYSAGSAARSSAPYLRPGFDGFRAFAEAFKQNTPPAERGRVVAARKGYFGYFAGLETIPVPDVETIDELVDYLRSNAADYLFFSFYAADTRPGLVALSDPRFSHPGLRPLASTPDGESPNRRSAILFRVVGPFPSRTVKGSGDAVE